MSLPAPLKTKIGDLQAAFRAAGPIASAPPLVFAKVDKLAFELIVALDKQVDQVGTALDGFTPGASAAAAAAALTAALQNAGDELDAFEARSYLGRFAANIELIEGWGRYFAQAPHPRIIVPTALALEDNSGDILLEDDSGVVLSEEIFEEPVGAFLLDDDSGAILLGDVAGSLGV